MAVSFNTIIDDDTSSLEVIKDSKNFLYEYNKTDNLIYVTASSSITFTINEFTSLLL